MIALTAFAAFVFDFGQIFTARAELQTAADAAVMAAADALPDGATAHATAITYGNANDHGNGPLLQNEDVVVGHWDDDTSTFTPGGSPTNAIEVNAQRSQKNGNPIPTLFAGVLGISEIQVRATAIGARDVRADVLIAQDATRSFIDEIDSALSADKALVDVFAAHYADAVQMGAVSFARDADLVWALDLLTGNQDSLKSAIEGISACASIGSPGGPCYGTDLGVGISRAHQMLRDDGRDDVPQVIVLVSDGVPCLAEEADPVGAGQAVATAAADAAAADGISIFVITLYEDTGSAGGCSAGDIAFNESLARGFGWGVTTTDAGQLESLLESVVDELPVRLVK